MAQTIFKIAQPTDFEDTQEAAQLSGLISQLSTNAFSVLMAQTGSVGSCNAEAVTKSLKSISDVLESAQSLSSASRTEGEC